MAKRTFFKMFGPESNIQIHFFGLFFKFWVPTNTTHSLCLTTSFIFLLFVKCTYVLPFQQMLMEPQLCFGQSGRRWAQRLLAHNPCPQGIHTLVGKTKTSTTHLLTHLFKKYGLGAYYVPRALESMWDAPGNKRDKPTHRGTFIPMEERRRSWNNITAEAKTWMW